MEESEEKASCSASGLNLRVVCGPQLLQSELSQERLLVFQVTLGWEDWKGWKYWRLWNTSDSESSLSWSLTGASLPWSMLPEDNESSDEKDMASLCLWLLPENSLLNVLSFCGDDPADRPLLALIGLQNNCVSESSLPRDYVIDVKPSWKSVFFYLQPLIQTLR